MYKPRFIRWFLFLTLVLGVTTPLRAQVLHHFGCENGTIDGCGLFAGLIEGTDGYLYGTTGAGGISGGGTVFKISKDGQVFQVLRSFDCATDGCNPITIINPITFIPGAALIEGRDGFLYGTNTIGGASVGGTVFKISKDGQVFNVLWSFDCANDQGCNPYAALIEGKGSDDYLYGTNSAGGDSPLNARGGTVFKIDKNGLGLTVLKRFACDSPFLGAPSYLGNDGCIPYGALIEASDGKLYGTTNGGGNIGNRAVGGTVFRMTKDGNEFTLLRSFGEQSLCNDESGGAPIVELYGCNPIAPLIEATDGNLYGTTSAIWSPFNPFQGAVFRIAKNGSDVDAPLKSFASSSCDTDGCDPFAPLVEGIDGKLYGTTSSGGGVANGGTVFKISKDGTGFTRLRSFQCDTTDGCNPFAGLTKASDSCLYGTTVFGGQYGEGTVYRLSGCTPSGSNIAVPAGDGSLITFSSVTGGGQTSASISDTGPAVPTGFSLGTPAIYYDLTTTATFIGSIIPCFTYAPAQFADPNNLRLLHFENGAWQDVTTSNNTITHIICGQVTSLSPFTVAAQNIRTVSVDIKPGSFPNTINLGSNGVVPVAILSSPDFNATTVDPTTLKLASAGVKLTGKGTPMYSLQDVNGDGLLDMIVHVTTSALTLTAADTMAVLEGRTTAGQIIKGRDTVRVVP